MKNRKPQEVNSKAGSEPFEQRLSPKVTVIVVLTAQLIITEQNAAAHNAVHHMHNGDFVG